MMGLKTEGVHIPPVSSIYQSMGKIAQSGN
jgi:hypothetical protein